MNFGWPCRRDLNSLTCNKLSSRRFVVETLHVCDKIHSVTVKYTVRTSFLRLKQLDGNTTVFLHGQLGRSWQGCADVCLRHPPLLLRTTLQHPPAETLSLLPVDVVARDRRLRPSANVVAKDRTLTTRLRHYRCSSSCLYRMSTLSRETSRFRLSADAVARERTLPTGPSYSAGVLVAVSTLEC